MGLGTEQNKSIAKIMYKILIVSIPGSPKRKKASRIFQEQALSWEWIDGVKIESMDEIPAWEKDSLEAYHIERLKFSPEYVCRAVGCKRAMRRALDRAELCQEEWVVIMQDDAVPVAGFDRILKELLASAPAEAGAVLLHRCGFTRSPKPSKLEKMNRDYRSMTSFAVRPAFARVMSEALSAWGGEADRIWKVLLEYGESLYYASPVIVTCNQKGSDIISGIPELSYLWQ